MNMVDGLILAGGRSRRFGRDKALLTYQGINNVERACEVLSSMGVNRLLLSRNQPDQDSGIALAYPELQQICDQYPDRGPLSGVLSGLQQASHPLLVMAVDMPLVTGAMLKQLIKHSGISSSSAVAFADHPLPCLITRPDVALAHATRILADVNAKASLFSFLTALGVDWLPSTPWQNQLANVNTPADWEAFIASNSSSKTLSKPTH